MTTDWSSPSGATTLISPLGVPTGIELIIMVVLETVISGIFVVPMYTVVTLARLVPDMVMF